MARLKRRDVIEVKNKVSWLLFLINMIRLSYIVVIASYAILNTNEVAVHIAVAYESAFTLCPILFFHIYYSKPVLKILIPQIFAIASIAFWIYLTYDMLWHKFDLHGQDIGWETFDIYWHLNEYLIVLFFFLGVTTPIALILSLCKF